MTVPVPPVTAIALFFDDIRKEVGNKLTCVGQYVVDLGLPAGIAVDRLAILLHLRWPLDYKPESLSVRVDLPTQGDGPYQPLPIDLALPVVEDPHSPFSQTVLQGVLLLRLPPLRGGDAIAVWVRVDKHDFPAGRLFVRAGEAGETQN